MQRYLGLHRQPTPKKSCKRHSEVEFSKFTSRWSIKLFDIRTMWCNKSNTKRLVLEIRLRSWTGVKLFTSWMLDIGHSNVQ